ncbi:CPCC family cysteine-rich protein [Jatrophihabitans lederbergiae]|uniref:CPCC family cysteine-rich protein n=1 Tax=Jatrophihabitans lederbergiae TaxID=3075547 RepID=UPI0037C04E4D
MNLAGRLRWLLGLKPLRGQGVQCGPNDGPYACPCCRSITLAESGAYELCPVCFWEDDGQEDHDADEVRGGPNGPLSLTWARTNFAVIRASDRAFLDQVRPPRPDERPATRCRFALLFAPCRVRRSRRSISSARSSRWASTAAGSSPAFGTKFVSSKLTDTRLSSWFARTLQVPFHPADNGPSARSSSQVEGHVRARQAATDQREAVDPGLGRRSWQASRWRSRDHRLRCGAVTFRPVRWSRRRVQCRSG